MLTNRGRIALSRRRALIVLPIWTLAVVWQWQWWFMHLDSRAWLCSVPLTVALLYETTLIPGALLFLTLKARAPANRRAQSNKKVAVITLCVPSQESIDIIKNQLTAMKNIRYPHDSWILDEGKSTQVEQLANELGVKYFSRKGIKKYNLKTFPFQERSKAGNVNAWLHKTRRYKYEFFVQLDIDHIPNKDYLDKTLGHFRDPNIAWVQSPSVYGNLSFWTARGSAEQEMGMHGPLQMGYFGATNIPIIVGSHAAYRTLAINEIGGFQPTRAEDQLNTLVLASKGWRGVFVPEVLAVGDGPETLSAYLTQQYAWARSIIHVIKGYSWRYFKELSSGERLQFVFLQSWYPLATLSFFTLYLLPLILLLFNIHIIDITFSQFSIYALPFLFSSVLLFWAAKPIMQPTNLNLSWRGILLHLVRWPIIASGILSALTNRKKPYQVTPKGKFLAKSPTLLLYRPFLLLSLLSASAVCISTVVNHYDSVQGQMVFALYDALAMVGICLLDLNVRLRQISLNVKNFKRYWLKPVGVTAMVTFVLGIACVSAVAPVQESLALSPPRPERIPPASALPVNQLNNVQLDQEISNPKYKFVSSRSAPTLGLYNTSSKVFTDQPYIRSIFIDWQSPWQLRRGLVNANRSDGTALVTIEPKGEHNGHQLLVDINNGVYDNRVKELMHIISLDPNTVYVRFAQEMDLPNSFVWGNQDPSLYINAYQRVVNIARTNGVTNVQWMWSPAGIPGSENYYPGDEYVDVIGTTLLYDKYWSGTFHPSFYEIQATRQNLFVYGKPVWIAEFGAGKDNPSYQSQLIRDAINEYKMDGYAALVYLNIKDPNIDGPDYRVENISVLGSGFSETPFVSHALAIGAQKPSLKKIQKQELPEIKLPTIFTAHK